LWHFFKSFLDERQVQSWSRKAKMMRLLAAPAPQRRKNRHFDCFTLIWLQQKIFGIPQMSAVTSVAAFDECVLQYTAGTGSSFKIKSILCRILDFSALAMVVCHWNESRL
jgi:hypothetical protein